MKLSNHHSTYYKHIDGLRALAVMAVILLHFNFPLFGGGFVGVDVFFVISGFLISNLIIQEQTKTGHFNYLRFYVKRTMRIMPPLFFLFFLSLMAGILLLSTAKFKLFGGSMGSAAAFVSNIYFWKHSGYFDLLSQSNPLLNTWSLGVEEQFYLLWPIFIVVIFKFLKKYSLALILTVFTTSLVLNFIYESHPHPLYYLIPFRTFEFCIGAFCCWALKYKIKQGIILETLCLLGLALILISIFFYSSQTLFPSYPALVPTIGAALVIYSGEAQYSGAIFRFQPVRFLGWISYSLYLVHWPLISFVKTYKENLAEAVKLTIMTKFWIFLAAIIIATLMFHYIEKPSRHLARKIKTKKQSVRLITTWLCIIVATVAFGVFIFKGKGWLWRVKSDLRNPEINVANYHQTHWGGAKFNGGYIHKNKNRGPDLVVMGDSHAGMLFEGLQQEIAIPYNLSIFTASGGGAGLYASSLLIPGITRLSIPQEIYDFSAKTAATAAISELLKSKRSIFLLSAAYASQLPISGYLETHKPLGIKPEIMTSWEQYQPLIEALERLRNMLHKHTLVIIGDVPRSKEYQTTTCIQRLKWLTNATCSPKEREPTDSGTAHVNNILSLYASMHKNVFFISTFKALCKDHICLNIDPKKTPIYSDGGHLSQAGSIYVVSHIKHELLKIYYAKNQEHP